MEIQTDELERIIKFYRISDDLDFIGFRTVDPDTFWYVFQSKNNPRRNFILHASDYISWCCGEGEPPEFLEANYFTDFICSFPVKRWLTSHDGLNLDDETGDREGYLYWASTGDRCMMAEIEGEIPEMAIRTLKTEIPIHDELEIAAYARHFIGNETFSEIPRPSSQDSKFLDENIRRIIRTNMLKIAEKILAAGVTGVTEEDLENCNSESFRYTRLWPIEEREYKPDWVVEKDTSKSISKINEVNFLVKINNQSWLALCEIRDFPNYFDERNILITILNRYIRLHSDRPGPRFLPRQTVFSILEKFKINSAGELRFQIMIECAKDCRLYVFVDDLDTKYVLICRDVRLENLDQEKSYLAQESGMEIADFYRLKDDFEEYYYTCNENEVVDTKNIETAETEDIQEERKYYFLAGRVQD